MAVSAEPRHVVFVDDDTRVIYRQALLDLLDEGMTIVDIAVWCGVTPQSIHYQLRRMGYRYSRTQGWRRNGSA